MEYDADTEEWVELTSTFINQKTYLPQLNLLIELKLTYLTSQRNQGQFLTLPLHVGKISRKITMIFHYFVEIKKNTFVLEM